MPPLLQHGAVALFDFGRRYVADGLEEPSVAEPIHPLQSRELDVNTLIGRSIFKRVMACRRMTAQLPF